MQHDTGFGLGTGEVKRRHILPKALVVGVVAGLLATSFRLALAFAEGRRVSFLSTLATPVRIPIAGGLTLGREGPTIQMGGATGLMVSEWFRVKIGEGERKALIAAGAGAGLAAAFNAPLAGVMFVLEELAGSFTPVVFVSAFLASVTADVVGRVLTGEMPIFQLHDMPAPNIRALPAALLLGVICGLGGVFFNRCLLKSLDFYARLRW